MRTGQSCPSPTVHISLGYLSSELLSAVIRVISVILTIHHPPRPPPVHFISDFLFYNSDLSCLSDEGVTISHGLPGAVGTIFWSDCPATCRSVRLKLRWPSRSLLAFQQVGGGPLRPAWQRSPPGPPARLSRCPPPRPPVAPAAAAQWSGTPPSQPPAALVIFQKKLLITVPTVASVSQTGICFSGFRNSTIYIHGKPTRKLQYFKASPVAALVFSSAPLLTIFIYHWGAGGEWRPARCLPLIGAAAPGCHRSAWINTSAQPSCSPMARFRPV